MKTEVKIAAECPSCGENVVFDIKPQLGQVIICRYCGEELEVIDLTPILLDFPIEDEEYDSEFDYEDDYDDDRW